MLCPYCQSERSQVVDSRTSDGNDTIRRRRQCLSCDQRYTTYERVEMRPVWVVKRDGRKQPYRREKLIEGLAKALQKRDVPLQTIQRKAVEGEQILFRNNVSEVTSSQIGDYMMRVLKDLDGVAYLRFMSVYRDFSSPEDFVSEISKLAADQRVVNPARVEA